MSSIVSKLSSVGVALLCLRDSHTALSFALGCRYFHSHPHLSMTMSTDSLVSPVPKNFDPFPFAYHTLLTLRIEELTNLGMGVARVNIDIPGSDLDNICESGKKSNFVVFVPNSIPGEVVKARIYRNNKSYSEADLIEVLESSPGTYFRCCIMNWLPLIKTNNNFINIIYLDRVSPQCKYFGICGGCQYQMLSITAQRQWKKTQVQELMSKLGGIHDGSGSGSFVVHDVIGTDDIYKYRTKITPHYNAPRTPDQLKIGFQMRGSRKIVDIDRCIITSDVINNAYANKRKQIAQDMEETIPRKGRTLLFREGEEGVSSEFGATITQKVDGHLFRFRAGEFFQNNAFVLPLLIDRVISLAKGDGCRYLVDAYCGSGLFSIFGANAFEEVKGVEISELAVQAATVNAKLNDISNIDFICSSSEHIFESLSKEMKAGKFLPEETCIVIDPPRKGCDKKFLSQLFSYGPKKLVYVSCDPATQARDAKIMINNGYKPILCSPFDLFPQTRHIENVMLFRK